MQGASNLFNIDTYVEKYLPDIHYLRDENGGIVSNRGPGGRYFPNAQDAYFKDHGYVRVERPAVGDRLVYIEVEGATIDVTYTMRVHPDKYRLTPIYNGKPFDVDTMDNGYTYVLLKKATVAARTNRSRGNALRKGPRTKHRLSGGRTVRRRTTRAGS